MNWWYEEIRRFLGREPTATEMNEALRTVGGLAITQQGLGTDYTSRAVQAQGMRADRQNAREFMQQAMATATNGTSQTIQQWPTVWETPFLTGTYAIPPVRPTSTKPPETLPLSELIKTLTKGGPDRIRLFVEA